MQISLVLHAFSGFRANTLNLNRAYFVFWNFATGSRAARVNRLAEVSGSGNWCRPCRGTRSVTQASRSMLPRREVTLTRLWPLSPSRSASSGFTSTRAARKLPSSFGPASHFAAVP